MVTKVHDGKISYETMIDSKCWNFHIRIHNTIMNYEVYDILLYLKHERDRMQNFASANAFEKKNFAFMVE